MTSVLTTEIAEVEEHIHRRIKQISPLAAAQLDRTEAGRALEQWLIQLMRNDEDLSELFLKLAALCCMLEVESEGGRAT
jgi:hypothetical protein